MFLALVSLAPSAGTPFLRKWRALQFSVYLPALLVVGVGVGGGVAAWPAGRPFSEGGVQGGEGGTCENARDEGLDAGLRLVISI